jgi:hypothetical protein
VIAPGSKNVVIACAGNDVKFAHTSTANPPAAETGSGSAPARAFTASVGDGVNSQDDIDEFWLFVACGI